MRKPKSLKSLEELGRIRLSNSFYMRDFLYSEISNFHGIPNIPDDPDLAISAGSKLCEELLEPIQATFGRLAIRSAYRSAEINSLGNQLGHNCASNDKNYAHHIWDKRDAEGNMGATVCIVVPWFSDQYAAGTDWRAMAWWIHDHLPYSQMEFFTKKAAFNINWRENPEKIIKSRIHPRGIFTRPGAENHDGSHAEFYKDFPAIRSR